MIELPEARVRRIINGVLDREGEAYTNDPADHGGPCKWGVTESTARAAGYQGDMRELSRDRAYDIYFHRYVEAPRFADVLNIDPCIGAELIDTGVNMGQLAAGRYLQRCLNAFDDGSHYSLLLVDGVVGDGTLNALRSFLRWRGPMGATALLRALNCLQGASYIEQTEHDPSQRRFAFGWLSNRVEIPTT